MPYYNEETHEIENMLIETPRQTIDKINRAEQAKSPYEKLNILLGRVLVKCECNE